MPCMTCVLPGGPRVMPCTLLYVLRSRHIARDDDDSVMLVRAAVLRVSCVLLESTRTQTQMFRGLTQLSDTAAKSATATFSPLRSTL